MDTKWLLLGAAASVVTWGLLDDSNIKKGGEGLGFPLRLQKTKDQLQANAAKKQVNFTVNALLAQQGLTAVSSGR